MYLDPQHWLKGSGLNVFTCFRGRAILSSCGQSASGQLMVSSPLHRYSCVPTMLYRAGHVATFYCSFAKTTPRQRNRALLTSKNMKSYKASVSKQSSYNDIVQCKIVNYYCLKTCSQCRGSVVACPVLLYQTCQLHMIHCAFFMQKAGCLT